jgi:hypothetical protein
MKVNFTDGTAIQDGPESDLTITIKDYGVLVFQGSYGEPTWTRKTYPWHQIKMVIEGDEYND